ncbi:hypothetical protein RRF57_009178 [Xylaria bambusicola]|uniref:Uncharacterized protein n=1 Tax=Xylaria bambusicola TaxID=326684 RepID=A0AAN7UPB4_9PEZI
MSLFIFALFIVGVPCLDLSAAGTLDIDIEIGASTTTTTSLHTPHYQLGHWLSTSPTIVTQTTISLDPSCATSEAREAGSHTSSPALIATELSTQTVTKTISRISLVTVTAGLCAPLSKTVPLITPSPKTTLYGTAPTRSTHNSTVSFRSFKMGTPPIPSPVISTSRGTSSTVVFETGTPLLPSSHSVSAGLEKKALLQQVWPFVAIMVLCTPLSGTAPPVTFPSKTSLLGTTSTHSSQNSTASFRSFKMGTTLIPSPTRSTGSEKDALFQQVWSSFAAVAVAFGFLCL